LFSQHETAVVLLRLLTAVARLILLDRHFGAREVARVINAPGMYAAGSSPAEFAAFLQHDYDDQDQLMTKLGLKAK